jgi:protein involved in polysaccharide export with SLBB domain
MSGSLPQNLFAIAFFAGLSLLASSCTSSDPVTDGIADIPWSNESVGRAVGSGFKFRQGDILELYVLEDSSLDGEYPVRQTGDVIISRLGRVEAVGLTTRQIEADIKRRLEQSQLKEATVIVDTPLVFGGSVDGSGRPTVEVYIYGQVAQQGLQKIPSMRGQRITCLDAVVHAGGFTPFANKKKVAIVRKTIDQGNFTIPVDLTAVEEGTATDVELREGDIVRIPQKKLGFGF